MNSLLPKKKTKQQPNKDKDTTIRHITSALFPSFDSLRVSIMHESTVDRRAVAMFGVSVALAVG